MYCPVCGGRKFNLIIGGNCSQSCAGCGKFLWCKSPFSDGYEKDSLPIKDHEQAMQLRVAYAAAAVE